MDKKNRQVMVVGLGRFGASIARTLSEDGVQVLGIDRRLDLVESLQQELSKWYEHHAGDCARALEYARAAQKHCPPEQAEAVERRVDRLLRKTEKSNLEE